MGRTLGWPDLLIEDRSSSEFLDWLEPWQWCVTGRKFTPICLSRFGCWFLQRPDGKVDMLDVFFGDVEPVAGSVSELNAAVEDPAWQAAYLLSDFVYRLQSVGKFASGISCYALAPHPAVGGPDPWGQTPLETDAVMIMDAPVWQGLCSQIVLASREVHS